MVGNRLAVALRGALEAQAQAVHTYEALASRAANAEVRSFFTAVAAHERTDLDELEGIARELVPEGVPPVPPGAPRGVDALLACAPAKLAKAIGPRDAPVPDGAGLERCVAAALGWEKASIARYTALERESSGVLAGVFRLLAEIERRHAAGLGELHRLLRAARRAPPAGRQAGTHPAAPAR